MRISLVPGKPLDYNREYRVAPERLAVQRDARFHGNLLGECLRCPIRPSLAAGYRQSTNSI